MNNWGIIAWGSPDPDDADDARCLAGPIITYFVTGTEFLAKTGESLPGKS